MIRFRTVEPAPDAPKPPKPVQATPPAAAPTPATGLLDKPEAESGSGAQAKPRKPGKPPASRPFRG